VASTITFSGRSKESIDRAVPGAGEDSQTFAGWGMRRAAGLASEKKSGFRGHVLHDLRGAGFQASEHTDSGFRIEKGFLSRLYTPLIHFGIITQGMTNRIRHGVVMKI